MSDDLQVRPVDAAPPAAPAALAPDRAAVLEAAPTEGDLRGGTAWTRTVAGPLRAYLGTESGSSGVLLVAIVAALVWANVGGTSYEATWHAGFALRLAGHDFSRDLRTWINSGLMTLFFLVVGLEARREFDLGDLRDRSKFVLPMLAGLLGMAVPVGIYALINHGGPGAHGWGVAMSTDTALALGLLVLLGRNVPERVRLFLLTIFVVDDVASLLVIAIFYSTSVRVVPLVVAALAFLAMMGMARSGVRGGLLYLPLGLVVWGSMMVSGVDPVVSGLIIGLFTPAYTPAREDLERATGLVRLFREQPTPELVRSATAGLTTALSPNERQQNLFHPWTSFVIVPLFGLANAGISVDGSFLMHAYTTPVTLGIIAGYVLGKPLAVFGASWALARATHGKLRPQVGWASVLGSGTIAGVGFTVALLIATLAFDGPLLAEAKLGVLTAAALAAIVTALVFKVTSLLPKKRRIRALLGVTDELVDLYAPVDAAHDHIRGPETASVTVVEYGDFECPYCGRAEDSVRALIAENEVRYVWRHLPLQDVHPQAELAAEASEAAAEQDAFWPMHDLLFAHQDELGVRDLIRYAGDLGLDVDRFHDDLKKHRFHGRVAEDRESADLSGVTGTPTFFVNGQRHYGAFDIESLKGAVKIARARAWISAGPS